MEITIKYYGRKHGEKEKVSHESKQEWEKVDEYCPFCGHQNLWMGDGDDYYQGRTYLCVDCDSMHHLDLCGNASDRTYQQVLAAIRERKE